jgi:hypothetical protein
VEEILKEKVAKMNSSNMGTRKEPTKECFLIPPVIAGYSLTVKVQ